MGLVCVLSVFCLIQGQFAAKWEEVRNDYTILVSSYTSTQSVSPAKLTNIVPLDDQDQTIIVNISLDIFSLTGFDAVAGRLDIYGSVQLAWQDEIVRGTNYFTGNVESLIIDYTKIWTPTIILFNSADSVAAVGDITYKVRFYTVNGTVTWAPRAIMAASCTPDVSFFPFDQQECEFIFTPSSEDKTKIQLSLISNKWGMSNYDSSGVWEVVQTSSDLATIGDRSAAKFSIVIKRMPLYFAFNIVLPILLLAFLSGFLFLLPVDSGERVGFAITCFLSFAIILQTIMRFLPQASAPMSLLCYYVIVMVGFSGLLSIVNILILKVYLKPDSAKVPRVLVHFIELIQCIKFKKCYRHYRRNKIGDSNIDIEPEIEIEEVVDEDTEKPVKPANSNAIIKSDNSKPKPDSVSSDSETDKVDWYSVGKILDFFFLLTFLGVQGAFSVFFLIPLGVRY